MVGLAQPQSLLPPHLLQHPVPDVRLVNLLGLGRASASRSAATFTRVRSVGGGRFHRLEVLLLEAVGARVVVDGLAELFPPLEGAVAVGEAAASGGCGALLEGGGEGVRGVVPPPALQVLFVKVGLLEVPRIKEIMFIDLS